MIFLSLTVKPTSCPGSFESISVITRQAPIFQNLRNRPLGKWWNTNPITKERREKPSDWTMERLIEDMDTAGIDKACMLRESFLTMSYNGVPCSTNFHTIEAMEKYPDRIIGCSNVGPHLIRGVNNATKELEILHRDYGFK